MLHRRFPYIIRLLNSPFCISFKKDKVIGFIVAKICNYFILFYFILFYFILSSLHGDGFQFVVIGGTLLHFLFKAEAVVRLVPEIEVVRVVLRGINGDHAPGGERNVDVKHAECEADDERRP
jgi:hypothetical protein